MSGRYVPPARRRQSENVLVEKPPVSKKEDSLVSLEEIRNYFWPVNEDEPGRFSHQSSGKTLHDSAKTPGKLAYLFLFNRANPRWDADRIIFTKSSLELLPADLADEKIEASSLENVKEADSVSVPNGVDKKENIDPNDTSNETDCSTEPATIEEAPNAREHTDTSDSKGDQHLIAVFKQVRGGQGGRAFKFDGWYQIDKLAFLEPRSAELVKMLQQKFKNQVREQERWNESLRYRWAVLKLKKDESADKKTGPPKIERMPDIDPESPKAAKKSVNEMLAEMRMGDKKPDGEVPKEG